METRVTNSKIGEEEHPSQTKGKKSHTMSKKNLETRKILKRNECHKSNIITQSYYLDSLRYGKALYCTYF